ncbi:MAG: 4-(cytidine 5'-diphospho)-2-C-methyl-D-erythritol kinase [Gemmatimonadota bacterium]
MTSKDAARRGRDGFAARVEAPAKVNLTLKVLGRRPDGFHELDTVFQAVAVSDRVTVTQTAEGRGIDLEVVTRGGGSLPDLGPMEENLAYRAACLFLAAVGDAGAPSGGGWREGDRGGRSGVAIRLEKAIPPGAGVGGGSSDAAAVLRALNALYGGVLTREALRNLGAELGSDVPFFLGDSVRARGRGRGEVLTDLPPLPARPLVLVFPPVHVATGEAYAALAAAREGGFRDAGTAAVAAARTSASAHAPSDPWGRVYAAVVNDFEKVIAARVPEVTRALQFLRGAGPQAAALSGSGGACFALFGRAGEAEAVASAAREELGWPAAATSTLESWPSVELGGDGSPPGA